MSGLLPRSFPLVLRDVISAAAEFTLRRVHVGTVDIRIASTLFDIIYRVNR
jgi:hypothetical protein